MQEGKANSSNPPGWNSLAPREAKTARLIAMGLTNRQAADQLGTTELVIKFYLTGVYDKLGVWNREELAIKLIDFV